MKIIAVGWISIISIFPIFLPDEFKNRQNKA